MQSRLRAAGLAEIDEKLQAGERLSFEDGVRLFEVPDLPQNRKRAELARRALEVGLVSARDL